MVVLILAVLGLCLGSFVNALVWRLHQQELQVTSGKLQGRKNLKLETLNLSILSGRSMCPVCRHELAAKDLVPIFSWLGLRGRCRYCQAPISWQYPLVELALPLVFIVSYLGWPTDLSLPGQWLLFGGWLAAVTGLLALAVYDLRWLELPNRILYPAFFVTVASRLGYIAFYGSGRGHQLLMLAASIAVASGFFALLFYISKGRWIGFGDVRLGLVTGTLLATPARSLLMLFLASVLGTLCVLPLVAAGRTKMTSRMPFGPFLILATGVVLLYGQSFLNWYQSHFL